jgi:hypothetical protein
MPPAPLRKTVSLRRRGIGKKSDAPPLRRKDTEILLLVNALLRDGAIIKFDTDREGRPFYAPVDYLEPADRLDNSDLVFGSYCLKYQ